MDAWRDARCGRSSPPLLHNHHVPSGCFRLTSDHTSSASENFSPCYPLLPSMPTYLIVGASRGIGLEFTTQLLARNDPSTFVYATARDPATAHLLEEVRARYPERCDVLRCDVASEESCTVSILLSACVGGRRCEKEGRAGRTPNAERTSLGAEGRYMLV